MTNNPLIIICTRPDSKRLPNKVFRRICGYEAIEHILERVMPSGFEIVLAIPYGTNDCYSHILSKYKTIKIFEGDSDSPLHRMKQAWNMFGKSDYIIRITHDDILIDCKTMVEIYEQCRDREYGYACTPSILEGAGVEIFCKENLIHAYDTNKGNIEHISYFVKGDGCPNPKILTMNPRKEIQRPYRLTLDYPEDEVVLNAVLRDVGPLASNDEICEFIDRNYHIMTYNRQPLLTIYTCVFNAEKWILDSMRSIICSMSQDMEYLIIDDGSNDRTLSNIMKNARSAQNFKIIVNEDNVGLSSSSNVALTRARGKYIMRLDADDCLYPDAIDKLTHEIRTTDSDVIYPGYRCIDIEGNVFGNVIPGDVNHHVGGAIMDKRLLNEIRFREGLRHWDSLDLYNQFKKKNCKISYIDEPLFMYRQRKDSLSNTDSKERKEVFSQITKTHSSEGSVKFLQSLRDEW